MYLLTLLLAIWMTLAFGQAQQYPVCTADLVKTDDCADVINPAACYNQFRWNARTLTCIDGADNKERQRKVGSHKTFAPVSVALLKYANMDPGLQMLHLRRHRHVQLGHHEPLLRRAVKGGRRRLGGVGQRPRLGAATAAFLERRYDHWKTASTTSCRRAMGLSGWEG